MVPCIFNRVCNAFGMFSTSGPSSCIRTIASRVLHVIVDLRPRVVFVIRENAAWNFERDRNPSNNKFLEYKPQKYDSSFLKYNPQKVVIHSHAVAFLDQHSHWRLKHTPAVACMSGAICRCSCSWIVQWIFHTTFTVGYRPGVLQTININLKDINF